MKRKNVWKAAGVLVTMLILCEIILPSSWKMSARGISLMSSILYFLYLNRKAIAVRWSKKTGKKQPRKNATLVQLEPDYKKLFVQQAALRIQEKMQQKFAGGKICLCEADIIRLPYLKRPLCVAIEGVDGFSHMNISMTEDGMFRMSLFTLVDFDTISDAESEKQEHTLDNTQMERWYTLKGQHLLTELVTEMNQQGFSRLSIQENGDVVVQENGKYVVKDHVLDFPPKKNWLDLKKMMMDTGIKVRINEKKMTFMW